MMQQLQLSNGSRLAYRDSGRGEVLLLVHGWGVSGALFEPQFEALAGRFRVLVPDLPGHGMSGPCDPQAGFAGLADALLELLEHLQVERVCLVGWSLGAMVGWDLLHRHGPGRITRLVSIDMVPYLLKSPDWPHGLVEARSPDVFARHAELIRAHWPDYMDKMVPRIFRADPDEHTHALIRWAYRVARHGDPEALGQVWIAMGSVDLRGALRGIELPTLVVAGRNSQLYGVAAGQWVAAQIPGAELEIFEQSGHAPHLEEPGHFNRLLAQFAGRPIDARPENIKTTGTHRN